MEPNVVMVRCIYNRNVVAKLFIVFATHLLARTDPEFFKGGLVPWGCRINGACSQNVAI